MLRSLRYGEADRILHLYTPQRGRVSAIAKGVRRARSRFGGRLEPFFRLQLDLHEGRGELLTVTGAETVEGYPRLRSDARALDAAARACDAVGRLFETDEPHPGVFNLLCRDCRCSTPAPPVRVWAHGRARVSAEADARRRSRPPARSVRGLRRARASRRLLRRCGRGRVRRLRGRLLPARPRRLPVHDRGARAVPVRGPERARSRRSARSSARSPRRSSTTPTCA